MNTQGYVKFGDIAQNIAVRVDPAEAKTDVYVGLEHLDSESLHLKQWGHPSDVTGQKLVFQKGDVIFGRRRAYQRKLAVAPCDGICSAHAMVLRAIPEMILPEFLPFFLQSDMFMERAIEISVGSLSPTINWKTMRVQEFPLPPLDEQKRIAEILWAADEAVEKWHRVQTRAVTAMVTTRRDIFRRLSTSTASTSIRNVGHWVSGGTPSRSRRDYWNGEFPWVSPKDMKRDLIIESEEKITELALQNRINILPAESVMIVVRGMILAHTFPVALAGREVTINQDMKGIVPNEDFLPIYVFHWFKDNAERILQSMEESTHGTKRLATDVLFEMQIPKADLTEQAHVTSVLETFRKQIERIIEHIEKTKRVKSRLLNSGLVGSHV